MMKYSKCYKEAHGQKVHLIISSWPWKFCWEHGRSGEVLRNDMTCRWRAKVDLRSNKKPLQHLGVKFNSFWCSKNWSSSWEFWLFGDFCGPSIWNNHADLKKFVILYDSIVKLHSIEETKKVLAALNTFWGPYIWVCSYLWQTDKPWDYFKYRPKKTNERKWFTLTTKAHDMGSVHSITVWAARAVRQSTIPMASFCLSQSFRSFSRTSRHCIHIFTVFTFNLLYDSTCNTRVIGGLPGVNWEVNSPGVNLSSQWFNVATMRSSWPYPPGKLASSTPGFPRALQNLLRPGTEKLHSLQGNSSKKAWRI